MGDGEMKLLSIATFIGLWTLSAPAVAADNWYNRPEVLRSAEVLATEVEHFDEALHDVNAPTHVIQKVHHFEETVMEFVDDIRAGASYQSSWQEFQHIRQDVASIRQEMSAHSYLLQNQKVNLEWNALRRAYRYLDHAMLHRGHNGAQHARMEADIKALERHQAETAEVK